MHFSRNWLEKVVVAACIAVVTSLVLSGCSLVEAKKKSGLQVMTNDIPSSLFLDGQYLEKTPYINKEIQPGTYTLKIQPDDPSYQPHETTVTLRQGLLSVVIWKPGKRPELSGGVIYEMEKLSNKKATELSIRSIPDGSIVSINDGEKEFTPLIKTDLPAGEHKYQVSLPSYETQQHTVNLEAGHRVSVFIKLAKSAADSPGSETPTATSATTLSPTGSSITNQPTPPPSPSSVRQSDQLTAQTATPSTLAAPAIIGPSVTINSTNFFVNGKEVLRVRGTPSSAGSELGFAPIDTSYAYLQETSSGWHKISFEGQTGWVSTQFTTLKQ